MEGIDSSAKKTFIVAILSIIGLVAIVVLLFSVDTLSGQAIGEEGCGSDEVPVCTIQYIFGTEINQIVNVPLGKSAVMGGRIDLKVTGVTPISCDIETLWGENNSHIDTFEMGVDQNHWNVDESLLAKSVSCEKKVPLYGEWNTLSLFSRSLSSYVKGFNNTWYRDILFSEPAYTYDSGVTWENMCSSEFVLKYYSIQDGQLTASQVTCPEGFSCQNGACMTCEESNYNGSSVGITIGYNAGDLENGRNQWFTNFCKDSSTLIEFGCAGNIFERAETTCTGGCTMSNGLPTCIQLDTPPPPPAASSNGSNSTSPPAATNGTNTTTNVTYDGSTLDVSSIGAANATFTYLMDNYDDYVNQSNILTTNYTDEKEELEKKYDEAEDEDVKEFYSDKLEDLEDEYENDLKNLKNYVKTLDNNIDDTQDDAKDAKKDALSAGNETLLTFYLDLIKDLDDLEADNLALKGELDGKLGIKKKTPTTNTQTNTTNINASVASNSTNATNISASCSESWTCAAWGTCVGGIQSRTCTDQNACGTALSKPKTSQVCVEKADLDDSTSEDEFDTQETEDDLDSFGDDSLNGEDTSAESDKAINPPTKQSTSSSSKKTGDLMFWLIVGSIVFVLIVVGGLLLYFYVIKPKMKANPTLVEFVSKERSKGLVDAEIKDSLVQAGWKNKDIDKAIKQK